MPRRRTKTSSAADAVPVRAARIQATMVLMRSDSHSRFSSARASTTDAVGRSPRPTPSVSSMGAHASSAISSAAAAASSATAPARVMASSMLARLSRALSPSVPSPSLAPAVLPVGTPAGVFAALAVGVGGGVVGCITLPTAFFLPPGVAADAAAAPRASSAVESGGTDPCIRSVTEEPLICGTSSVTSSYSLSSPTTLLLIASAAAAAAVVALPATALAASAAAAAPLFTVSAA
mmetsp:Transcript_1116/g.3385  ORF Transcript_1116/g.3385 Transcript_1116/m.3385 type:complete len:235 (+) Transcript_1116:317-1021(+)